MIRATDLYFVRVIELMIDDLRQNKHLVKDIVSDVVSDPILSKHYGIKEVQQFEKFLSKEIQVNVEYSIDVAKLPAIAIRIGGGVEDTSPTGDVLSDGYGQEIVNPNSLNGVMISPRIVVGPITAISYDKNSGKIVVPDTVNLGKVYAGMHLYDEVNQKSYEIILVDSDTSFYIAPKIKDKINLNNFTIRSPHPDKAYNIRRYWMARETVTLTCLSVEPAEVIYLYQMLLYLIGRHRLEYFEGVNFRVATVQYGPLQRMMEDPNIIFGREITLTGSVLHTYIERTVRPIEGITSKPYIADMGPTLGGVWEAYTKNQGWAGELDIDKDI